MKTLNQVLRTTKVLVLSMVVVMSCSVCAIADQRPAEEPSSFFPTFTGRAGYDLQHIDYDFGDCNQSGYFNGFFLSADFHLNNVYLAAEASFSWGNTDMEEPGIPTSTTSDKMYDVKALFGYDFLFNKIAVTPYAGLATRFWETNLDGNFGFPYSFQQYYAPIGAKLTYKSDDPWYASIKVEYDWFLLGQIKNKQSSSDPGLSDADYDQRGGYGIHVSASFIYSFGCWALGAEPYFQYWNIDESDSELVTYNGQPLYYACEADNTNNIWGLRVFLEF